MRRVRFVDLVAQQRAVGSEVQRAVVDALDRTDWILGTDVQAFEEELAAYCGAAGAVGTDSGLSALELALRAVGVGPGDEVVIPGNTFIATALAVSATGATPVLADVEPLTHLLDPARVEEALTPSTRAIVPVHLYGQLADMEAIGEVARRHDLRVVEDACQAHGARRWGRRAGTQADAAAFSFYPSKNLGAYGDGGAVVSSDPTLLDEVRMLRNYGQRRKYHHVSKGFNRRLDTVQAAALRVKLRHLDAWNEARADAALRYSARLSDIGVLAPQVAEGNDHVWHLFVIQVQAREEVASLLGRCGVETGIHYPVPIHRQPAYGELAWQAERLPIVDAQADHLLSLPMHPFLSEADTGHVVDALASALDRTRMREAIHG